MPLVELKSKYRKVSSIDKIGNGWQEEYDASSKQVTLKLNKLIQCWSEWGSMLNGCVDYQDI